MILTKEGYITSIGLLLPDNSTQQISPADLRTSLTNLADSVHIFLSDKDILAQNVDSISTRTTLVGDGAIANRDLVGRSNQDNSAFGYNALHGNYDGAKNTAIGATALSCNLYGDQNVAVGYNAIAGNTIGSGNVGIGNFALQTNKKGDFNIAIGHGAGAYIGEESNYNFYVGAHPVDYEGLCDTSEVVTNIPLLFGDLLNRKLGVGVNSLHDFGSIQSSGGVSPSQNSSFNLGHGSYNWGTAFLTSGLSYPSSGDFLVTRHTPKGSAYPDQYDYSTVFSMDRDGYIGINTETPSGSHGILTVDGNIVPNETHEYSLGRPELKWHGWFNDVVGDNLDILQDAGITGLLNVTGDATFGNDVFIRKDLAVDQDTSVGGNLVASGNVDILGSVYTSGHLNVVETVDASGNVTFGSGLTVMGSTIASGQLDVEKNITVLGTGMFGHVLPRETDVYALGSPSLLWDGYFNDVVVTGQFHVNDSEFVYNTIIECIYDCKTLHLATSGFCDSEGGGLTGGALCGYLSDASLDGAGFEIHSSGIGYLRDYRYIFKEPDQDLTCLEVDNNYARSRWQSNISIEVTDGLHMQTQRLLSDKKLSLVTQSGCHGLFFRTLQNNSKNITYLGSEDHVEAYSYNQPVNFIGPSGNGDYYVSVATVDSGVTVGVDLATRISGTMHGFGLENHDDLNADTDRFALRVHNNNTTVLEPFSVLRASGLVGITNIAVASGAEPIVPATLFNVQGDNSCNVRFSSSALGTSSLDIIGNGNTRASGMQIVYNPSTDIVDLSLIRPSGGIGQDFSFMSVANNGYVGIGRLTNNTTRNVVPFEPLVISHSGVTANSGTIAIKEQSSPPSATSAYGKLYIKPKIADNQTQSIFFLDDNGNEFDIITGDHTHDTSHTHDYASSSHTHDTTHTHDFDSDTLYVDIRGNTYAGSGSPESRPTLSAHRNTTLGYYALNSLSNGSSNIAIGSGSLQSLTTSSQNTVVGVGSLFTAIAPDNNTIVGALNLGSGTQAEGNVIIGYGNIQESLLSKPTGCIVIGTGIKDGLSDTIDNYTLAIGHGDTPLIYGSMGGSNGRFFDVKSGNVSITYGNLSVSDGNLTVADGNFTVAPLLDTTMTFNGQGLSVIEGDISVVEGNASIASGNLSVTSGNFSISSPAYPTKLSVQDGSLSLGSQNDRHVFSISHAVSGERDVAIIDYKDNDHTSVNGLISLRFTDTNSSHELMQFDHTAVAMPLATNEKTTSVNHVGPTGTNGAAISRPFVKLEGDMLIRGAVQFADGTHMDSANVQSNFAGTGVRLSSFSNGKRMHLDFMTLADAETLTTQIVNETSHVAVSVASGTSNFVGSMTFKEFGDAINPYAERGYALVSNHCNHVWSNSGNAVDTINNSGSVLIGCGVAASATGWRNAVMIGAEAGVNATTPNVGLTTDTPVVFIGQRAGRDADNISNSVFIGTNAGYLASSSEGSIYIGQSAGADSNMDDSIGIGGHALRGMLSRNDNGKNNIEIVAGLLDSERLMHGSGHLSSRLNIQNSIAGKTDARRISIGDAILNPDAPLSVRLDHAISGHSGIHDVQTWYCDDTKVAQVTCNGDFESLHNGVMLPNTIEGFAMSGIPCPGSYLSPTSGMLRTKGYDFIDSIDVSIVNRDARLIVQSGAYVVAQRVNREYRPIWVNCSGV